MRQLTVPPFQLLDHLEDSGTSSTWDTGTSQVKSFKTHFRQIAGANQNHRCAFCVLEIGIDTGNRSDDIEHFAPKQLHPEWTFEILNLMLACELCNRRWKRVYDTVESKQELYDQCTFRIVHPYLDNVSDHIMGGYPADLVEPSVPSAKTNKGKETIRLFKLADPDRLRLWTKDYRSAFWDMNPDVISRLVDTVMTDFETP